MSHLSFARLLAVCCLAFALVGCDDDDDTPAGSGGSTYAGLLSGGSAGSIVITLAIAPARGTPFGVIEGKGGTPATGLLALEGRNPFDLTGSEQGGTVTLSDAGSLYTFTGTLSGDTITGDYMGGGDGTFSATRTTVDAPWDLALGTWRMTWSWWQTCPGGSTVLAVSDMTLQVRPRNGAPVIDAESFVFCEEPYIEFTDGSWNGGVYTGSIAATYASDLGTAAFDVSGTVEFTSGGTVTGNLTGTVEYDSNRTCAADLVNDEGPSWDGQRCEGCWKGCQQPAR